MTTGAPLACVYDADANGDSVFRVMRRFKNEADRLYTYGERYVVDIVETTQSIKDRGFHAFINECWMNLPEKYDGEFPTADDFRKWCLIECGFAKKTRSPAFDSEVAAQAAIPLIIALSEDFCLVEREGRQIVVTRALSQKLSEARGGMPLARRLESYKAVKEFASDITGVPVHRMEKEAGQSA